MYGGPAPTLYFNYRTEENEIWENSELRAMYSYDVKYPSRTKKGIVVSV